MAPLESGFAPKTARSINIMTAIRGGRAIYREVA
jgi:hypothetical protein